MGLSCQQINLKVNSQREKKNQTFNGSAVASKRLSIVTFTSLSAEISSKRAATSYEYAVKQ